MRRIKTTQRLVAYALLLASAAATARSDDAHMLMLASGDGSAIRVLYVAPEHPRATLVMLPGGAGEVGVEQDGDVRHGDNFVVRTRDAWLARGYAVMIADVPGHENLRGQRSSPAYAARIATMVDAARERAHAPIFLFGTSQGSIAAMNGAAHAPVGSIAGVVLTESVSMLGGSHETVFDADPGDVRVPALVVANRDDACNVAPPSQAPRIVASMRHSPDARIIYVRGGTQHSADACGSLTPHGYFGIEDEVVARIARWLDSHG